MEIFYIIKILFLTTSSFVFAFLCIPILLRFLYKYKMGKQIRNSGKTPVFSKMHAHKAGTPTMGGILIWGTVLVFIMLFWVLFKVFPDIEILEKVNFLSRKETLLPLGALIFTAIVGLFDDWLDVRKKGINGGGGLSIWHRLLVYLMIAVVGALWFYFKLDWTVLHIPFFGNFEISWWYIPFFIFVIVGTSFSVNETDGLDGLAGGVLLMSYTSFGVISFVMGKYDLASFCAVIVGALCAFLWANINPAKFFMGDTGAMSLGVTLGIIAMLTNNVFILPIVGLIFLIETISVIFQLSYKKINNGKKIFISTPIHNHLQAIGWTEANIVMRFWVISGITSIIGLIVFLIDKAI